MLHSAGLHPFQIPVRHSRSLNGGATTAGCAAQVTGGRNGYGAKLANIFSTEFVIETCDGKSLYKQVEPQDLSSLPSWQSSNTELS